MTRRIVSHQQLFFTDDPEVFFQYVRETLYRAQVPTSVCAFCASAYSIPRARTSRLRPLLCNTTT